MSHGRGTEVTSTWVRRDVRRGAAGLHQRPLVTRACPSRGASSSKLAPKDPCGTSRRVPGRKGPRRSSVVGGSTGSPGRARQSSVMRSVILLPRAEVDLFDAAIWYETEREGLGRAFEADFDQVVARVQASPHQFCLMHAERCLAGSRTGSFSCSNPTRSRYLPFFICIGIPWRGESANERCAPPPRDSPLDESRDSGGSGGRRVQMGWRERRASPQGLRLLRLPDDQVGPPVGAIRGYRARSRDSIRRSGTSHMSATKM